MFTDVVILAGGFGERLWPASSREFPKQFMTINDDFSFLQYSILRALKLKISGLILIITRSDIANVCCSQVTKLIESDITTNEEKIKLKNDLIVVSETMPKHTTAPLLLSCYITKLFSKNEQHSIMVLTSDHVINPIDSFVEDCNKAAEIANQNYFVCFAIPPVNASTAYGYIKAGLPLNDSDDSIVKIMQFKEKPDSATAIAYLKQGGYWWNSGMFAFTADFFIKEIANTTPEIALAFDCMKDAKLPQISIYNGIKTISNWTSMDKAYKATPAIAVDIAIAEKTARAVAVRASYNWVDVGSWDTFAQISSKDTGLQANLDSSGNFVYSDIDVSLCGVKDLIIVIKNGHALILQKGKSDLVRQLSHIVQGKN